MSQAIFRNHQKAVASFLHKTHKTIDIAMCWFTNPFLFFILLKKVKNGVQVRLVLQFDQANFHPKGLAFLQMVRSGTAIRVYDQQQLLHHKFAIADTNKLLTGSYNWTGAQHAENLLLIGNQELVQAFGSEFENLWKNSVPLIEVANRKAPPPGFLKLFKPIVWDVYDLRHAIILKNAKVWVAVFKEEEMLIWKQCLEQQRHFLRIKTTFFEQYPDDWEQEVFDGWVQGLSVSKKRLLLNYCKRMRLGDIIIATSKKGRLLAIGMIGSNPESSHLQNYSFARYVQWFEFSENVERLKRLPYNHFGKFYGSGLQVISLLEEKTKTVRIA